MPRHVVLLEIKSQAAGDAAFIVLLDAKSGVSKQILSQL
jgi:hypothetical protein